MIAAKFGDPVLGIDIHAVALPPPASVPPTPLPHPFIGIVFDPLGAALGAVMGKVFGGGGPVFVNGLPCGNTGTGVKGMPHIPTPPGILPHPTDAPTGNEGTLVTGSKTVHFMGSSESRTLSSVSSCGYPLNLPTSLCMSVPMGMPVLIGGPEAVDWVAAATTAIRTKWMSEELRKLVGEGFWRNKLICMLTGHPVDVMTGELLAEAIDFEVPGLIPIKWERNYRSRQKREGALGPGWTHPFDQRIEEAADGVRLWLADGRPKRYRPLALGQSHWDSEERHTIHREREGYEVRSWDGIRRRFRRVVPDARGRRVDWLALAEILDPAGNAIRFTYERGLLVHVIDTAGRDLEVRWNNLKRIEGVLFDGQPIVRYEYDDGGRLAAAIDPLGHALRYQYRGGVLVKETHKGGLAFFFEWDWEHPEGWCKRTWGENPRAATQPGQPEGVPRFIYDRKIKYDPVKHFTSVEDGRGGVTQYWGNEAGLVEKVMDPAGCVTLTSWSDTFQKTSETDGEGNKTEWEYDERGNCVLARDPMGRETRRLFDLENRLVSLVEPAGGTWNVSWDQRGKPQWIQNPLGFATGYRHDDNGRLIGVEDPMGRAVALSWAARNELQSLTDGEGRTTTFQHDDLGRVSEVRDAAGRTTRVQRDGCGRVTYLEHQDGQILWLELDEEGNVVEQTDADGRKLRMKYQGMSRLTEHIDPMGHRVRLVYDTEEELVAVENQLGERYRFVLDLAGRVKEEVGFDGKKLRYLFDKAGRTARILSPDYLVTILTRDPLGRVTRRGSKAPSNRGAIAAEIEEQTFEFDDGGHLTRATTLASTVEFERDALGQIIRERQIANREGAVSTIEHRYDLAGLRIERDTSLGHRTEYEWDRSELLVGLKASTSRWMKNEALRDLGIPKLDLPDWEMRLSRDELGMETSRELPGVLAIWKRDAFARPIERRTVARRGPRNDEVARVGYHWRSAEQIAALVDSRLGTTTFDHDARGQLVGASMPDGSRQLRMSDPVSNVYKSRDGSDRAYGRGGRLERIGSSQLRYDGHGNLVEKLLPDGARWTYRWNTAGRLEEVIRPDARRVAFEYDALGRRTRKQFDGTVTEYVWEGHDLAHERVTNPDGSGPPVTTWVFEPGAFTPVAKLEADRRYSIVCDHLGTPTEAFTEDGKLAWRGSLDVWGVLHEETSAVSPDTRTSIPWRYPGQYEDAETGLYYNRFRYYDPESGRYISEDQLPLSPGLSLQAYTSDPLRLVDPMGLKPIVVIGETQRAVNEAARLLRQAGHDAESMGFPRNQWGFGEIEDRLADAVEWNKEWLRDKIHDGYHVVDIGEDALRSQRSPFYAAEREVVREMNAAKTVLRKFPSGEEVTAMRKRIGCSK